MSPSAVQAARAAVRDCAARWDPACEELDLSDNIVVGNSLIHAPDAPARWHPIQFRRRFPGGQEPGRFDLVVGNPPYVDSEEMSRSAPEQRRYLAAHYGTAKGNWDLYCPFVERAVELLGEDGRLGLILPNKLLAARYARELRQLLATLDLVLLRDYSEMRLFQAAVYPLVLVARRKPRRRPMLRVEVATGSLEAPSLERRREVAPAEVAHCVADGWSVLFAAAPATGGPRLTRLGELARVVGAASVAEAYALKPLVRECDHHGGCYHLINTGTIDPYGHLWARKGLRYLGATYERPCVEADALEGLLPRRAVQTRAAKIVVAGLARRLECVLDPGGLLAGKSTSLVLPADDSPTLDLALLLALLNSAAASVMLRRQFGGLALSGGYLRIGPPQLRALQLPDPAGIPLALQRQLRDAALALGQLAAAGEPVRSERWSAQLCRVDEPCWALFGLSPDEES